MKCGKSARRLWYEANVSPNVNGRMTVQNFVNHLVANNAQQLAVGAGVISQQTLDHWIIQGNNQGN